MRSSPKKMNKIAPEQRKGANGSASLRPAPVSSMHVNPTTEPTREAKKSVTGIEGQPRNAQDQNGEDVKACNADKICK